MAGWAHLAVILTVVVVAAPVGAFERDCSGTQVHVAAEDRTLSELICDAARTALARLAEVKLAPSGPADILVVSEAEALHHGRVASFASTRKLITLLDPGTLADQASPASGFSRLDADTFYAGLVLHELAHLTLDEAFGAGPGPIAHEYVAYALQLDILEPAERKAFLQGFDIGDAAASIEYLNWGILMLSPDVFAAHAWHHFQSQGADADAVEAAMTGRVAFPMDDFPW
jgi:hypothetical protein